MTDSKTATERGSRLTAEQVRDFLNRHSVFNDTTWLYGRQELVFDENELQAMADELNATLGSGECEIVLGEDEMGCTAMVCSKCGKPVDDLRSPNFCPYCAAMIRKAVKR